MSGRCKKNLLKYGITGAVGILLMLLVLYNYGIGEANSTAEKLKILSNALTIPGTIIFLIGVLCWIANAGGMRGLDYVLAYAVRRLLPGNHQTESYLEYTERKRAAGGLKGYGFLLITGLVFLIPAIACTVLYYYI